MKILSKCIVCNTSVYKELFLNTDRMLHVPGQFVVKKCINCNLVFLDPQPERNELKKYYPSKQYYSYSSSGKNFFSILRRFLIKTYFKKDIISMLISSILPQVPAIPKTQTKGKILDIGCGSGDTLLLLKAEGWDVYGVEIDKHAVGIAHKKGLKNVRVGSYEVINAFPNEYFDVIRMYHVIEHLDDPGKCLKLMNKKLKKNGEIIVGTPNIESIVSKVFGRFWYNLDTPRHIFLFSPKTLSWLTKKNRFITKKIEYCSAGGIVGSMEYFVNNNFRKKNDFIHKQWLVLLMYPLERIIDLCKTGDIFVLTAKKNF